MFTDTDIRHSASMRYAQQNASMTEQNGCHSADDICKCIFLQGNVYISTQISLNCASKGCQWVSIGLGCGLAPIRWQTITRNNDDPFHRRICAYASPAIKVLMWSARDLQRLSVFCYKGTNSKQKSMSPSGMSPWWSLAVLLYEYTMI